MTLQSDPAEKLKIITPLKDTDTKEGQEVVLNCEVNTEGAKAKWLKNEETVFESSKYVMVQRDNVFSLRIKDAQKGDEANYSINLTNQRGEQAKSAGSLTVKGQHVFQVLFQQVSPVAAGCNRVFCASIVQRRV